MARADQQASAVPVTRAVSLASTEAIARADIPTSTVPTARPKPPRPLPPKHPSLGTLEPDGYRPPPDTIAKVLRDHDRPVFDRGRIGGDFERNIGTSKRDLKDQLREAVLNTAAMQEDQE